METEQVENIENIPSASANNRKGMDAIQQKFGNLTRTIGNGRGDRRRRRRRSSNSNSNSNPVSMQQQQQQQPQPLSALLRAHHGWRTQDEPSAPSTPTKFGDDDDDDDDDDDSNGLLAGELEDNDCSLLTAEERIATRESRAKEHALCQFGRDEQEDELENSRDANQAKRSKRTTNDAASLSKTMDDSPSPTLSLSQSQSSLMSSTSSATMAQGAPKSSSSAQINRLARMPNTYYNKLRESLKRKKSKRTRQAFKPAGKRKKSVSQPEAFLLTIPENLSKEEEIRRRVEHELAMSIADAHQRLKEMDNVFLVGMATVCNLDNEQKDVMFFKIKELSTLYGELKKCLKAEFEKEKGSIGSAFRDWIHKSDETFSEFFANLPRAKQEIKRLHGTSKEFIEYARNIPRFGQHSLPDLLDQPRAAFAAYSNIIRRLMKHTTEADEKRVLNDALTKHAQIMQKVDARMSTQEVLDIVGDDAIRAEYNINDDTPMLNKWMATFVKDGKSALIYLLPDVLLVTKYSRKKGKTTLLGKPLRIGDFETEALGASALDMSQSLAALDVDMEDVVRVHRIGSAEPYAHKHSLRGSLRRKGSVVGRQYYDIKFSSPREKTHFLERIKEVSTASLPPQDHDGDEACATGGTEQATATEEQATATEEPQDVPKAASVTVKINPKLVSMV